MFIPTRSGIVINPNKIKYFSIEPRPVCLIWAVWDSDEIQEALKPSLGPKCYAVIAYTGGGHCGEVCLDVFLTRHEAVEYINDLARRTGNS
jgi:hypothetical protein